MQSFKPQSKDDLVQFLNSHCCEDTIFFTNPYYLGAILGISNDKRLIYSYTLMVESLYLEYLEDENLDDPYTAAIEFIDFNIGHIGKYSPIIVNEIPDEGLDSFFQCNGLEDDLGIYFEYLIGLDNEDSLIFNKDILQPEKLIKTLDKYNLKYKFV